MEIFPIELVLIRTKQQTLSRIVSSIAEKFS